MLLKFDFFGLPPERAKWMLVGCAAVAVVAILIGMGALIGARGRVPEPTCSDATAVIAQVNATIQQGQLGYARQLADLALNADSTPVCPAARSTLGVLHYRSAIDEALAVSLPGTGRAEADHQALLAFIEAERVGDDFKLPPESRTPPLVVAAQAYTAGKFLLSQGAFIRAWKVGQVGPTQLPAIDQYYSTLYNIHLELLDGTSPSARQDALAALRTADAIGRAYDLPRAEAHMQLVRLLGADQATWPPANADDPILTAATPVSEPR